MAKQLVSSLFLQVNAIVLYILLLTSSTEASRERGHHHTDFSFAEEFTVVWPELHFHNQTLVTVDLNQDVTLNLYQNNKIIGPNLRIETLGEVDSDEPVIERGCYYVGKVSGYSRSSVAVSLCHDVVSGVIRYESSEQYIEPVKGYSRHVDRGLPPPHVLYRPANRVLITADDVDESQSHHGSDDVLIRHHRARRSLRGQKYMELYVIVDYSLVQYHGSQDAVTEYMISLVNIVDELYHDSSLGAEINVVMTRFTFLDSSTYLVVDGNPYATLQNVQVWLEGRMYANPFNTNHHDMAVFITKDDFGSGGYGLVNGRCNQDWMVLIAKDEGFTASFVIAHEMGHVLGMEHDGGNNDCSNEELGNMMSPIIESQLNEFHWSSCSRREIRLFLSRYSCLDDSPFTKKKVTYERDDTTFTQYSMDDQCFYDFGVGYTECKVFPDLDMCEELWCAEPDNEYYCKTRRGPALHGSVCGPGKVCQNFHCTSVDGYTGIQGRVGFVETVDNWGPWTDWTECTQQCDVGATYRDRYCENQLGEGCDGYVSYQEFMICNAEECSGVKVDTRAVGCRRANRMTYKGRKHTWLPYYNLNETTQCRLTCISIETNDVIVSSSAVADGTFCGYDSTDDVCINGQCETIGCERILHSTSHFDKCGICSGDDSECRHVADRYVAIPPIDEVFQVTVLPASTRELLISFASNTPHTTLVREVGTDFEIFNSNSPRAESVVAGTVFKHRVDGNVVRISAPGPLFGDVELVVLNGDESIVATILWEYYIHESMSQADRMSYVWVNYQWAECSATCGTGVRNPVYGCQRLSDHVFVNDQYCRRSVKRPIAPTECNAGPCPDDLFGSWRAEEWMECTQDCGPYGVRARDVYCLRLFAGELVVVDDRLCDPVERPSATGECNRVACPGHWATGEMSACSVTCGEGVVTRGVRCTGDMVYSDEWYDCSSAPRPSERGTCRTRPCSHTSDRHIADSEPQQHGQNSDNNDEHSNIDVETDGCENLVALCHTPMLNLICRQSDLRHICCSSCRQRQ